MQKYYVYFLRSSLGYNYIGQTKNLDDRMSRHNSNRSSSTKNKGHWEIVKYIECSSRSEAIQLEKKLKGIKNFEKALEYIK